MYSEEETELRDLIIQNLEGCGFLNKIKAELRAGVFLALEDDENLRNKIPLFNQKLDDFVSTSEGKLMISLVREFLEYFSLNFTLSVFDPEISVSTPCITRSELCDQFKLNPELDGPVILSLLKGHISKYKLDPSKPRGEFNSVVNKESNDTILIETTKSEKNYIDDIHNKEQLLNINNLENNIPDIKHPLEDNVKVNSNALSEVQDSNVVSEKMLSDSGIKSDQDDLNRNENMLKNSNALFSPNVDLFFDQPLPSEKPSFFNFADTSKEKPESKIISSIKTDFNDSKKSSLSSLKDLPSLSASSEWAFSRDIKNTLPSLDSLILSVSSSETSNEETVNLDTKDIFQKKDSDIVESNESSEKQNSESIEEEIEEDFSAGFEDLLNSSLSLGDDATTDQTVSQVSVVEGIDHVEPCNS